MLRNLLSDVPVLGLARAVPPGGVPGAPMDGALDARARAYGLWPLWTLLYCLAWFAVQDAAKVAAWRLLLAADKFGLRTGAVVAVREAYSLDDQPALDAAGTVEARLLELRVRDAASDVRRALARVSAAGSAPDTALEAAASTLAAASDAITATVHEPEPIFARTAAAVAASAKVPATITAVGRAGGRQEESAAGPVRRASLDIAQARARAVSAAPAGLPSARADPMERLRRSSIVAQQALATLEGGAGAAAIGGGPAQQAAVRSTVAGLVEAQTQLEAVEAALRERGYRMHAAGGSGGGGGAGAAGGARPGGGCGGGCGGRPRTDEEAG